MTLLSAWAACASAGCSVSRCVEPALPNLGGTRAQCSPENLMPDGPRWGRGGDAGPGEPAVFKVCGESILAGAPHLRAQGWG